MKHEFEAFEDITPGTILTICKGDRVESDFITPASLAGQCVEYACGIKGLPLKVLAAESPYLVVKNLASKSRHVIDTRLCALMPVSSGYVEALVGRPWWRALIR